MRHNNQRHIQTCWQLQNQSIPALARLRPIGLGTHICQTNINVRADKSLTQGNATKHIHLCPTPLCWTFDNYNHNADPRFRKKTHIDRHIYARSVVKCDMFLSTVIQVGVCTLQMQQCIHACVYASMYWGVISLGKLAYLIHRATDLCARFSRQRN